MATITDIDHGDIVADGPVCAIIATVIRSVSDGHYVVRDDDDDVVVVVVVEHGRADFVALGEPLQVASAYRRAGCALKKEFAFRQRDGG